MPMDRGDWLAPAHLDRVTVSVDFNRDVPGEPTDMTITGHSQKRVAPLWIWSHREDDPRNVGSILTGILEAVAFYKPTSSVKFLRACVGGEVDGPEDDPQLPF